MPRKNVLILAACALAIVAAGAMIWRFVGAPAPDLTDDLIKRNAEATQGTELQAQPDSRAASPAAGPGGRFPAKR